MLQVPLMIEEQIWIGSDTEKLLNALRPYLEFRQMTARKMDIVRDKKPYLELINRTNDEMLKIIGISRLESIQSTSSFEQPNNTQQQNDD